MLIKGSICIFIYNISLSLISGLKDEGDENEMKDMSILPSYGMLSEREKKVTHRKFAITVESSFSVRIWLEDSWVTPTHKFTPHEHITKC